MSYRFDGVNGRLVYEDDERNFGGAQYISIAATINADSFDKSGMIWGKTYSNNTSVSVTLLVDTTGKVRMYQHDYGTNAREVQSNVALELGRTYRILGTAKPSNVEEDLHIFIDGVEVETTVTSSTPYTPPDTTTGYGHLGGRPQDGTRNFEGRIEDVAVWQRQLDAQTAALVTTTHSPAAFPQDLRVHCPLRGHAIDVVGGYTPKTYSTVNIADDLIPAQSLIGSGTPKPVFYATEPERVPLAFSTSKTAPFRPRNLQRPRVNIHHPHAYGLSWVCMGNEGTVTSNKGIWQYPNVYTSPNLVGGGISTRSMPNGTAFHASGGGTQFTTDNSAPEQVPGEGTSKQAVR